MNQYCESLHKTKRRRTREVMVGSVGVGGNNPVRIQSMTTSNTRDVEATIEQTVRLADAGCEIVRLTVQGMKEAEACEKIKNGLLQRGYEVPLVADIHFYPPAAMRVVEFVDKVRINPGNFADRRASFQQFEYTDDSYRNELDKIEEKFAPLVEKCKHLKKPIRIGANHGSLSDRIMNRYGDTPQGMVASAVEYTEVCREYDFHDIIFSMKSSNPQVMIQAYRLLAAEMYKRGWDYPLHLGVTEAGQDEDGRVKSAMGIGALLLDGLGDTIRVSLTEDPWHEIDPCRRLVQFAEEYKERGVAFFEEKHRDIGLIERRTVAFSNRVAFHRDGTVVIRIQGSEEEKDLCKAIGVEVLKDSFSLRKDSADQVLVETPRFHLAEKLSGSGVGILSSHPYAQGAALITLEELRSRILSARFSLSLETARPQAVWVRDEDPVEWDVLLRQRPEMLFLSPFEETRLHYARHFFEWLRQNRLDIPVILAFSYSCSKDDLVIRASAEMGALLCDGLGEGVFIDSTRQAPEFLRRLSFGILQAARMRTFQTEFISCPSCGRTLFDLQDVTKRIRTKTSHLPGVKIAIMGCIVNGPGEMADADFGYVGSRPGMIDLYVGKRCVEKNIAFAEADERLIELIKYYDKWVEPVEQS